MVGVWRAVYGENEAGTTVWVGTGRLIIRKGNGRVELG